MVSLDKFKSKVSKKQELINDELDELREDFSMFEEEYLDKWIEQNEDWLVYETISEENLVEFHDDAINYYVNEELYRNVYIEDYTWDYLEQQSTLHKYTNEPSYKTALKDYLYKQVKEM